MQLRSRVFRLPALYALAVIFPLVSSIGQEAGTENSEGNSTATAATESVVESPSQPEEISDTPTEAKPTPHPTPEPTELEIRLGKSNASFAEVLPERPYKAIDRFFGMLIKGNIDVAYEILVQDSPIGKKPEDIPTLKEKTRQAVELFGAFRGYEIVDYDPLGTSLLRVTCVSLGELYPLRWHLYFYRVNGDWTLIDIRVDDKLSSLFDDEEATKSVVPAPQP